MSEKPDKPKILQADFEEFLADRERQIKRAPVPLKRRQPKVARLKSRRQQIAEGQSRNPIRSIYVPESKWSVTPIIDDSHGLTRDVGPHDNSQCGPFNPSKETRTKTGDTNNNQPRGARGPKLGKSDAQQLGAILRMLIDKETN